MQTDIEDRINECMQRSMNGKPLPMDSPEMIAMAAYLRIAGRRYAGDGRRRYARSKEPPPFKTPARAANLEGRQEVFGARCASVTAPTGWDCWRRATRRKGYLFPPLWGPDTFNNGAGMHRVLTAARFIKARMPLGEADLTDDQAFDVAAFINASRARRWRT